MSSRHEAPHPPDAAGVVAVAAVLRRRILILANPGAGGARRRRRLERVVAALRRCGCCVTVRHAGPRPGDIERLARDAEPVFQAIVAAGGDGTINAVANGLATAPRPLAMLPLGTANVLARDLDLPHEPEALAELIAGAPARPAWPGRVGGRLFVAMASAGFDAGVVAAVDPWLKRGLGRLAFAWAILCGVAGYHADELIVEIDGIAYRAAAIIAAKGRFYAGRYVVAPGAVLTDPALDFVLLHRSGRLAIVRYVCALLRGRLAERGDVTVVRARRAVVSTIGDGRAVLVQADGESVGKLPVVFEIAEQPLPLIGPRS